MDASFAGLIYYSNMPTKKRPDLSYQQAKVYKFMKKNPAATYEELRKVLGARTDTSVTHAVHGLIIKGYLARERKPAEWVLL